MSIKTTILFSIEFCITLSQLLSCCYPFLITFAFLPAGNKIALSFRLYVNMSARICKPTVIQHSGGGARVCIHLLKIFLSFLSKLEGNDGRFTRGAIYMCTFLGSSSAWIDKYLSGQVMFLEATFQRGTVFTFYIGWLCTHTHTHRHTHTHAYIHTNITHTHAHIHTHITHTSDTHTRTHTHTYHTQTHIFLFRK
jgi:hypothetical protein